MKVLVTGGAGFIGSHVAERLLGLGHAVRVLDNLSTGRRANLATHARLELVIGDVRDRAEVDACATGVDAIVHLAAVASVQASIDDPIATHASNFDGTLHVLEAARERDVRRLLYASSAAVYGDSAELPVAESATPRPLSPYAADKLAGEHYLHYYFRKHGLAGTAFRFFNIYGPRQDPSSPYSGVISIFVDRLARGEPVTLFGDGEQTRDFVYVGDLAALLCGALTRDGLGGETMNVGTGRQTSLLTLLDTLEDLAGRRVERRFAEPRVGDIRHSCADVRRLTQRLDAAPSTALGDGLAELLGSIGVSARRR
jgi:UDP-glucose 4-epimerase